MSSPTQRSLKVLRDEGYFAAITEHWNAWAKIRQDLFGFIDILAIKENEVLGVQTTSYDNINARIKKIKASEAYPIAKSANMKIVVHGWRKNAKGRWELTTKEL
jgi:hypothetical protein